MKKKSLASIKASHNNGEINPPRDDTIILNNHVLCRNIVSEWGIQQTSTDV